MSRFIRFIRIAWKMSGQLPWVGEPDWNTSDANELRKFLVTVEGKRFRMILLNMVLKQNQQAVSSNKELEFNAGFANGVRTTVHTVEALTNEIEEPEEFTSDMFGVDYRTSQNPAATAKELGALFGRG
tara:strand:- start:1058 stop:1441 length:384 start_codon:yes stop_codon:yes gene_type:complete